MYRPINEVTVQSFYLIPKDKQDLPGFDHDLFLKVIDHALKHVQSWFQIKLGCTFKFKNTLKLISNNDFEWFYYYPNNNPHNHKSPKFNGYYNCKTELDELFHVSTKIEPIICYLYGGIQGCALDNFTFLPLEDVFLLLKEFNDNKPGRLHGGLAHELSHSLGLDDVDHDNENYSENLDESKYLMGTGYFHYPNTELTGRNVDTLKCKNPKMIVTPALTPDPKPRIIHNP